MEAPYEENMRGENDDINNSPYGVDFCPMHHAVSRLTKIALIAQSSRSLRSCPSLAGELQLWGTKSFGKQRDCASNLSWPKEESHGYRKPGSGAMLRPKLSKLVQL